MAPRADPMTPQLNRDDAPESRLPDPTRVVVGAGAHAALGPGPGAAVGVVVSTELANLRGSVGLEGRYDLAASAPTGSGARARVSLAGAQLVPCLRAPWCSLPTCMARRRAYPRAA